MAYLLLDRQYSNCTKRVAIYSEEIEDIDGKLFNIDYDIEYNNGEGKQGNAFVSLEDALSSYGFSSEKELRSYYMGKYEGDEKGFHKIVQELEERGLEPNVEETDETSIG